MKNRFHIFATSPFLLCLCVLIFNDFYLKYAFHNELTGKLSDFAGLFIFPIFWSVLFPKYRKVVYFGMALFFIFWQEGQQTYFYENDKTRLIAYYHKGLEDSIWSYFLEDGAIEKKEVYKNGILKKTLLYLNEDVFTTVHSLWWITPKIINRTVWLVLLLWIFYLCYQIWKATKLAKSKWIFTGQSKIEIVLSILGQLFTALFTVIFTSVCSTILVIFILFLYGVFGFHFPMGMNIFLIPIYAIFFLFLPTFSYLLKKRTATEWGYFLILLIVLPLFGFQSFL